MLPLHLHECAEVDARQPHVATELGVEQRHTSVNVQRVPQRSRGGHFVILTESASARSWRTRVLHAVVNSE